MSHLRTELLVNGYVRVYSRASGLAGLYTQQGAYVHGDLRLNQSEVSAILRAQLTSALAIESLWSRN